MSANTNISGMSEIRGLTDDEVIERHRDIAFMA
jgi:hypothetical protein